MLLTTRRRSLISPRSGLVPMTNSSVIAFSSSARRPPLVSTRAAAPPAASEATGAADGSSAWAGKAMPTTRSGRTFIGPNSVVKTKSPSASSTWVARSASPFER